MAIIEGQIEPLKKIKKVLNQNGITRFGSIGDINDFIKNFETEKNEIIKVIKNEFDCELNQLKINLAQHQQDYNTLKDSVINETNLKIKELEEKCEFARKKSNKSFFYRIFHYIKSKILMNKRLILQKKFKSIVSKKTNFAEKAVSKTKDKLNNYIINRDSLISERCLQSLQELDGTKEVIDSLYNLIAGAVGENSVIKEVQKLPNNFHLFNDFSLEFNPPIYHKKEDDRIYSIQIDHLLISEAGIFILETKNWGKQSVESIDLRSPVKQILRSSYALFILLNNQSRHNNINLDYHHWGDKQIPVRSIIIMTNLRPREPFQHVKILSLKELNGYVSYFDPIFNKAEIDSICDYLRRRM